MGYTDPSSSRDLLGNRTLFFIFICAFAVVTLLQQILYGRNYLKRAGHVKNLHLDSMEEDVLYHLGLGTKRQDLPAFVCIGGSPSRMGAFAQVMQEELGLAGGRQALADRCATYRAGPLLSVSVKPSSGRGLHVRESSDEVREQRAGGRGGPNSGRSAEHRPAWSSRSTTAGAAPGGACRSWGQGDTRAGDRSQELIKLLRHTRCRDVTIIRIGTSGGLGLEAGSVIMDTAVDSSFKPRFEQVVLDDVVVRSTELDKDLAVELLSCSKEISDFPTLTGHTMCTYDFYKGQIIFEQPSSPRHNTKALQP